jgi:2-phosphosulfolactate phosphatase
MPNKIYTVLSPMLLQLIDVKDKTVVVIDILRATSSICVAFAHGAGRIIPVATPEECKTYASKGFICAAERDGKPVEGFDIGNSPFSYMADSMKGASIALTTTNGTQAVNLSKGAAKVAIGSFLNLKAICDFLIKENRDAVLLCSGWKNSFNLEDTLFAGAVASGLEGKFRLGDDAGIAAKDLYRHAVKDMNAYLALSSHAHRFAALGITEDIRFCLQEDIYDIVPVLEGDFLVAS